MFRLATRHLIPCSYQFSEDSKAIYFTAGDIARIKVFALPVPPTPSESVTDPDLPKEYREPVELTSSGAASGIQVLPNGRLLFTRSSTTSPNDVYVLRGLERVTQAGTEKPQVEQLTRFAADALEGKSLDPGEDFWFEGAEARKVHGWVLKPPGFKKGDEKKWPIAVLIHGGMILCRVDARRVAHESSGPQSAWEDQWSARWNPNGALVLYPICYVTDGGLQYSHSKAISPSQ